MIVFSLATASAAAAAFWFGRRSVIGRDTDFAALWRYQQALNDCGHEIDTLLHTSEEALSDTSRDELTAARHLAYPHATSLRPEAQGLIVRASIPSLVESDFVLVDLAHAYLALSEQLADEIVRAQFPTRRWTPFLRDVSTSRLRSA